MKDYFLYSNNDIFMKYEKVEEITQSDNHVKYHVKDNESGDHYIMSILLSGDIRIYNALQKIDNINILKIISVTKLDDGELLVIEEYIENAVTLQEKIDNGIDEGDFEDYLLQICDALSYLHKMKNPIIYNLITSYHIIIDTDNLLKLNDFYHAEMSDKYNNDVRMLGELIHSSGDKFKRKYHKLIINCLKKQLNISKVRTEVLSSKRVIGIKYSLFILIFIFLFFIARLVWIIFVKGKLV